MNWMKRWFGIGSDTAKTDVPQTEESEPEHYFEHQSSLQKTLIEAVEEVQREAYRREQELLNDQKLEGYLKETVKLMAKGLNEDTYSFVLIHASSLKMHAGVFPHFFKIAQGVFKEYGLNIVLSGDYFRVEKSDIRGLFDKLKKQSVNIDERTRAMLSRGIYR